MEKRKLVYGFVAWFTGLYFTYKTINSAIMLENKLLFPNICMGFSNPDVVAYNPAIPAPMVFKNPLRE